MTVRFATFMGGWKGKAQLMKAAIDKQYLLDSAIGLCFYLVYYVLKVWLVVENIYNENIIIWIQ